MAAARDEHVRPSVRPGSADADRRGTRRPGGRRAEPGQRGLAITRTVLRHAEGILGAGHPHTLTSRNRLATAYLCSGCPAEAITIYEPLLADRERIHGPEHLETFTASHRLALAYLDAGRVGEAIAIFEPLLVNHERVLSPEHPSTISTHNNLADH
jgi:hypothetical protein